MTDTKYLDEAARLAGWHHFEQVERNSVYAATSIRAHAATLEQADKFRWEVSDAVRGAKNALRQIGWPMVLDRFIIPTPDPIETACRELGIDREELARRGVKLVECE